MKKGLRIILNAFISLILGFATMVLLTALLDQVIWPSLMVAIPAGVVVFLLCFVILQNKAKNKSDY